MSFLGASLSYIKNGKTKVLSINESYESEDFIFKFSISKTENGDSAKLSLSTKSDVILKSCKLETNEKIGEYEKVFLNGYQTWTDSREFSLGEKIPKLRKIASPVMGMYGDYNIIKYKNDILHSFTYTYIRKGENKLKLFGSLSEKTGYTVFKFSSKNKNLEIFKDCKGLNLKSGETYDVFDILSIEGSDSEAFDSYFCAAEIKKPSCPPAVGWTSWYNYYTAVTENDVLENLNAFKNHGFPIDIFQIDDGYQNAVGDWLLINNKFPSGMAQVANKIHDCGYKAGLWLAPIICEKKSVIYKNHPDWVTEKAGFNPGWSGMFYALDFYNPQVREYLKMVFNTVLNVWHYDMVKLDFLYAACLTKRKDKTRGQIMFEFMSFLREICGDKLILGCGVPLGCAFGLVDYCRVSSDVALKWEDKMFLSLHYRERVSTINALTSTISRYQLNKRAFYNDPDVFILRDKGNTLTEDQKYTLFLLNSTLGGLVFTSDNINEYTNSQLSLFKSLFILKNAVVKCVSKNVGLVTVDFSCSGKNFRLLSNLKETEQSVMAISGKVKDFSQTSENAKEFKEGEIATLRPFASILIESK